MSPEDLLFPSFTGYLDQSELIIMILRRSDDSCVVDSSGTVAPRESIGEVAREAIGILSSVVQRGEDRLLLRNTDAFNPNSARDRRNLWKTYSHKPRLTRAIEEYLCIGVVLV